MQQSRIGPMALAALALPSLFWAGNFIVARAARGEVPPMALSYGRWLIAGLCMLPFALPHLRRDAPWYRANWKLVLGTAVTGVTLFNTLVYLGLRYTNATNGMLLNSTIPVLILLMGALFMGRPLRGGQAIGLAVSILGVAVIILHGEWSRLVTLEFSMGDLIIFGAMVSWAIYTLWLTRIPASVNRLGLLTVQIGITLVLLTPFLIAEIASGQVPTWSPAAIAALLYVGLVPSVLATLLYMKAVSLAGPALAGQSIHLLPLYGALLSTLFLGEELHLYHAIGFALILSGIVIAGRLGKR
ncbi:DMT family transporter [Paenirhodobacter sp.]|uniref:DMT family transporter n=1 Tax=Paenirhodobacter sp. TaxID=1965326 RepID=UPI003B3E9902